MIDAQARRGPQTPVTVNGRTLLVSPQLARDIQAAQARAEVARGMVRERDAEWTPTPGMFDPASPNGVLSHYRNVAQEAEA
ncbi:MAG: hypothetical protein K2Y05_10330, partial [Hyphomicrobiaceae bacterium]|nr:hypothetical protein [Hyphomicrobiaceae bacterium]